MSTSRRPYKFILSAVVQLADEDGNVVGEESSEPIVVFGCEALAEWALEFTARIEAMEAERNAEQPSDTDH